LSTWPAEPVAATPSDALPPFAVGPDLARRLRLVTRTAILAVLFVHSYNLGSRFAAGENTAAAPGAPGPVGFVEYLVAQALCRWPAALLFAVSGFLFFRDLDGGADALRAKLRRRLRTVLLPFLLWSALGLLAYAAARLAPGGGRLLASGGAGGLDTAGALRLLLWQPVAYPLWFLQTLLTCFALSPLLLPAARRLRWAAATPFLACWLAGAPASDWTQWKGLAFFSLGAVLALELRAGRRLPLFRAAPAVLPLAWLAACLLFTFLLRDQGTWWAALLHKGMMTLGVVAVWVGYPVHLRRLEGWRPLRLLLPYGFFIYAAQEPLLSAVKRALLLAGEAGDGALLAAFFVAPLLTLLATWATAAGLRRLTPRPYALLTGGR